ncbi:hypothetical protein HHI36_016708 [Cryptolaemus montrouzieri]|uniref:Uncharacterized protein n=1 Tax=Cryptolaemus montrouzieri TaxID=559131 RepID=A0ABD2NKK3_9CUCU
MMPRCLQYSLLIILLAVMIYAKSPPPSWNSKTDHPDLIDKNRKCQDESASCTPFVRCPAHVRLKNISRCSTEQGRDGVCCTTGSNHTEPLDEKRRGHHVIKADLLTLHFVSRHSRAQLAELRSKEAKLMSSGKPTILSRSSSSYSHFRNSRMFNAADLHQVMDVATRALEIAIATRAFKDSETSVANNLVNRNSV